jgi:uncharacterized protein (TIGR02147 family)
MEQLPPVFKYMDYLDYLEIQIKFNASEYGYKAQLAEAAGCQRSFISQVLSGMTHLMPEHAVGLSEFWQLSGSEKEYFLNLVLHARAGSKKLKEHYKERLTAARLEQENLSKRIKEKAELPEEKAAIFYSQWHYLAINILLTIPQYRTIPAISHRLGLHEEVVRKSLTQLEALGMAARSGTTWSTLASTIHVPRDSQFNALNHSHWRKRAVDNAFLASTNDIHYTSVCSLSLEDVEKLKDLVLQLIDRSRKIIAPSKEEELFCLTCDWFKV